MKVLRDLKSGDEGRPRKPVLTIGNFDGVHLGHREIIQKVVAKAKETQGESVVFTFKPHPQIALRPHVPFDLLSTYSEKLELLEKLGVDWVVEQPFSRDFSQTPAERFFKEVILRELNVEHLIIGYDFGFGKGRQGHLDVLKNLATEAGVSMEVVQAQRETSHVVSSSAVRKALHSGQVELANQLLGYSFFYSDIIRRGDGRGRKIGFPTANLLVQEGKILLPLGVYATRTHVGKNTFKSVTNVGVRPTFVAPANDSSQRNSQSSGVSSQVVVVETYLLDQDMDLYGHRLKVEFFSKIRDEKKFNGVEELKLQIAKDIEKVKSMP